MGCEDALPEAESSGIVLEEGTWPVIQIYEGCVPRETFLCRKEVVVAIRDNDLRCFYVTEIKGARDAQEPSRGFLPFGADMRAETKKSGEGKGGPPTQGSGESCSLF